MRLGLGVEVPSVAPSGSRSLKADAASRSAIPVAKVASAATAIIPDLTDTPFHAIVPQTGRHPVAKRPKPVDQLTAAQFDAMFQTESDCIRYLVARRSPEGVICPRCGNPKVYTLASGHHWQCQQCSPGGYRFSHLTGTIFENTNKPLKDWFRVTHLMLVSKKGMSALQLYRHMSFGSYKTAWLMCHKVRIALVEDIDKLGGIVEVDETVASLRTGIRTSGRRKRWDRRRWQSYRCRCGEAQGKVVARVIGNRKARPRPSSSAKREFTSE